MYTSDASSWGRSSPRRSSKKRRRMVPLTGTTSSDSDTMGSDNALEGWLSGGEPQEQPAKKTTKRLPTDVERRAELRHQPSAVLAANILEVAASIERVAATSGNLKGTYVRRLKDDAGKARANIHELAMRTKVTGSLGVLEEENISLRAKLLQAQEEISALKRRPQVREEGVGRGQREAVPPTKRTTKGRLFPAPREQAGPGATRTKSKDRPSGKEEETLKQMREEIRSLSEQVAALTELVARSAREEPKHQGVRQQQLPNSGAEKAAALRGRKTKKGGPLVSKADGNRPVARVTFAGGESSSQVATDSPATTSWSKVVGRKARRKEAFGEKGAGGPKGPPPKQKQGKQRQPDGNRATGNLAVRAPRRAAVALATAPGSEWKGAELIAEARRKVNLKEMGITDVKIRYSVAGNVLVEIPGEDRAAKADNLAGKLREIFPENEVKITRPVKRTDLRITGLDISVLKVEIIEAVAQIGGCLEEDVKIGEPRQRTPRGAVSVWLQCPAEAAKKLVDRGRVTVGWVSARVEALRPRPLACFRCLERGHTAGNCKSGKDRSDLCYNCGNSGHRARVCAAPSRCAVCTDAGVPANHRYGGTGCCPPVTRRSRAVIRPEEKTKGKDPPKRKEAPCKADARPAASRSACVTSDEEAMETEA